MLALLATIQSADVVLPTTDGRAVRLRRVTAPDMAQQALLDALGLTLPMRVDLNFDCSGNSATT